MSGIERVLPKSMAGRMIGILAFSFAVLLAVLTIAEQRQSGDIFAAAGATDTANRLRRIAATLERIRPEELAEYVAAESRCHAGYEISPTAYQQMTNTARTEAVAQQLSNSLGVPIANVQVGLTTLTQSRFGYVQCEAGQIAFPVTGLVISLRLNGGQWLHAEIHPHESHFQMTFTDWFQRSAWPFLLIAAIAATLVFRLAKPLRLLADGAVSFGGGLKAEPIPESGPPDLRRVITAFNAMQRQVIETVAHRNMTLAALSHDLRTPLTALRVKAELVEEEKLRAELVASIEKMEAIATSALEFLQGENRTEPMQNVDLVTLVESECADFEDIGASVHVEVASPILCPCRPNALSRAIRNLIDNAVKYGGGAVVRIRQTDGKVAISIADNGPGVPLESYDLVTKPFVRLSDARESEIGGSGLGLAVVKAVIQGHDGDLSLGPNSPCGLIATIVIPIQHNGK